MSGYDRWLEAEMNRQDEMSARREVEIESLVVDLWEQLSISPVVADSIERDWQCFEDVGGTILNAVAYARKYKDCEFLLRTMEAVIGKRLREIAAHEYEERS